MDGAMRDLEPRQYIDDDREQVDGSVQALRISLDDQGDVYVSIGPPEHKIHRAAVRLCASGGAGSLAPRLLRSMREAYWALNPDGSQRRQPETALLGRVREIAVRARKDAADSSGHFDALGDILELLTGSRDVETEE